MLGGPGRQHSAGGARSGRQHNVGGLIETAQCWGETQCWGGGGLREKHSAGEGEGQGDTVRMEAGRSRSTV